MRIEEGCRLHCSKYLSHYYRVIRIGSDGQRTSHVSQLTSYLQAFTRKLMCSQERAAVVGLYLLYSSMFAGVAEHTC
jgi:hypothetical protein